jgi:multiple sugar transport system permease protein
LAVAAEDLRVRRASSLSGIGVFLAMPAALALMMLFVGPTLLVFVAALTDWQLGADDFSFVGLLNFRVLFEDPDFFASLVNTLLYALMVVPSTVALGLGVALLIESSNRFRAFYRAVHFIPFMATMAAMALAWEALLHPTIGLVNQLLGVLGVAPVNWLRDQRTVLPVLALIGIWQNFGYAMVLFLAGLKTIPRDLYDAAEIDGADGPFDRLRTVTLPMLGPTLMFVAVVVVLRALEVFDTVSILTQGGPGTSSEVLLHTMYVESFNYLRTGYGAAISVVFLVLVTSVTLFQARTMEKRVHYT